MSGVTPPLESTRKVTIDALCEHFANDVMSMEDFEARLDIANRATTTDELKELLRDLPGGDRTAVVKAEPPRHPTDQKFSVAPAGQAREAAYVVAVMGGTTRKGRWQAAERNYAMAVMGGAELDFREAVMPPGVTEVKVFTMWGGVEIIVPPGMNVETGGIALMGGFEHHADHDDSPPDPNAPTLRITGMAVMAGVDVQVRLPGESARDTRRRLKEKRREMRRQLKKGRGRGRGWGRGRGRRRDYDDDDYDDDD